MVVGRGLVGQACARLLAEAGFTVEALSARTLTQGAPPSAVEPPHLCILAHGKPVTVKRFSDAFDDLLDSRIRPMTAVKAAIGPEAAVVLISSTVACLPGAGARDLPALQRAYEQAFVERFPNGSILRLAAMRGPGWQIDDGLPDLARTQVMKRIRLAGATDIPWADDALLARALAEVARAPAPCRQVVAHARGFDINRFLDEGVGPLAFRLVLPDAWFRSLYQAMGAPPAFMTISMDAVRRSGWELVASPQPEAGDKVAAPEPHLAAGRDRVAVPV